MRVDTLCVAARAHAPPQVHAHASPRRRAQCVRRSSVHAHTHTSTHCVSAHRACMHTRVRACGVRVRTVCVRAQCACRAQCRGWSARTASAHTQHVRERIVCVCVRVWRTERVCVCTCVYTAVYTAVRAECVCLPSQQCARSPFPCTITTRRQQTEQTLQQASLRLYQHIPNANSPASNVMGRVIFAG